MKACKGAILQCLFVLAIFCLPKYLGSPSLASKPRGTLCVFCAAGASRADEEVSPGRDNLRGFVERLHASGWRVPNSVEELRPLISSLKQCFRSFVAPPGLIIDASTQDVSPDEDVSRLFRFLPPMSVIDSTTHVSPPEEPHEVAAFLENDEFRTTTPFSNGRSQWYQDFYQPSSFLMQKVPKFDEADQVLKTADDPKHLLALIIHTIHRRYTSPFCRSIFRTAGKQSILSRIFMRKNPYDSVLEALTVFSLLQGNRRSYQVYKGQLSNTMPSKEGETVSDVMNRINNVDSDAGAGRTGIYEESLISDYWDLAHTKHQKQYASLETSLKHLAKDTEVGESVFFHIMANPEVNRKINALNSYIAGNQELVESLTERIGIMAKTSGDAFSMLIPGYNHLADFIRGVALYAFKNVMVKGPGVYVSPILPCGNSLSGPMVETLTGKPLLKGSSKYFVYQHTSPQTASIVPEHVWRPLQTEVTDAFAAADPVNAGYLAYVAPKVCVSEKQYKKCLSFVSKKKRPFNLGKEENDLCSFVIMHQGLFLEVDGKAVEAVRQYLGNLVTKNGTPQSISASNRTVQRFTSPARHLSRNSSVIPLLGEGLSGGCAAASLTASLTGVSTTLGDLTAFSALQNLKAAKMHSTKSMPMPLIRLLIDDFANHIERVSRILGVSQALSQG